MSSIGPVVSEEMFENVDGRTTDGRRTDGRRTTDAAVTGILIAHLGAFGSGELKIVYDQVLIHFVLIGDKSSKGAYEEVIPTLSQILSKLDLERLILVLRTLFVYIT